MAVQNFTTYTEVDSDNDISVTSSSITYTTMRRDANSSVYKDFGADYFVGVKFDFEVSFVDDAGTPTDAPWASLVTLSNVAAATREDLLTANVGLGAGFNVTNSAHASPNTPQIYIWEYSTDANDSFDASYDTTYYCTLTRGGTSGILRIYSDSARTTLLDTLSVTTATTAYRYLAVLGSRDSSLGPTEVISGSISNLYLYEELKTHIGSFTTRTTTGDQSITGIWFQPKVIIFFGGTPASGTTEEFWNRMLAFAADPTQEASVSSRNADNVGTASSGRHLSSNSIAFAGASSMFIIFTLSSMDSAGFTLNYGTANAITRQITYLAIGGDDLTNYTIGTFDSGTSTGNLAITGVGFQPDAVLFLGSHVQSTTEGFSSTARLLMGAALSSSSRWTVSHVGANATVTGNEQTAQNTTKCMTVCDGSLATIENYDFVSMDSDGFTVDVTVAPPSSTRYIYLALKGGQYALGSFDQPTSTGNQEITGLGFQPSALLFLSDSKENHASPNEHSGFSHGMAVSSVQRGGMAGWAVDEADPTQTAGYFNSSLAIAHINSTPTLLAGADFVSQDSDGFTVNWTTADSTARRMLYFAIGAEPTGTSVTISPFVIIS